MKLPRFAPYAAALCFASLAAAQTAQAPEKSPEAQQAESAVREQAQKFYDLLMAGKARAAEALVCEASKDDYYSMNKPTPHSVKVRTVVLSADLKSAKATVVIEDEVSFGQQKKLVKMPMPSNWKLEAGQWCYFLSPGGEEVDTPFGMVKPKAQKEGASGKIQPDPAAVAVNPEKLSMQVSFSKRQLALPSAADGKDEIVVSNGLNGPIQFQLACPPVPGLECQMDQKYISAGKQGKLIVSFAFKGSAIQEPLAVTLGVMPFGTVKTFPIRAIAPAPKP